MNKALMTSMAAVVAALGLAACGEKPQAAGTTPKGDTKSWESGATAYAADGYKAGDQAGWEQQLRQRAQNQNDFARAPAKPQ